MPSRLWAPGTASQLLAFLALLALPSEGHAQSGERLAGPVRVTGAVFEDRNGNGARDPGEPGLAGIEVSDQVTFVTTDADGRFTIDAAGYGYLFVVQPEGFSARGPFWRRAEADADVAFPMISVGAAREFAFLHASDTHLSEESLPRMRRLRAMVDSLMPAFVILSGDLVRDALRVQEPEARGYYEMLERELASFPVPVYTVPGNHEIFGIERHKSLVSETNPLYGKRMYRSYRGPDYYAFEYGGVHFVGLNSVDYIDLSYHGHVDSLQLAWLERDMARLRPGVPVVTFNHIPFVSASEILGGVDEDGVAPTLIRIGGRPYFRHTVYNSADVLHAIGDRLEIALAGHIHRREEIRYETGHGTKRFFQTAAVTGPPEGDGPLGLRSGVTLYRVRDGKVDDGTFLPLDGVARH